VALTIASIEKNVRGAHLRRQRQLAGFSIRALAEAARLSLTRIRQVEVAERVTPRSVSRYLNGIAEAWRARAEETATEETAYVRIQPIGPPNEPCVRVGFNGSAYPAFSRDVAVDDLMFKTILETRSIIEACARIA
jgi:transcriptional regulator with XRE-family HTH domain